jgi:transcription factor SPN1
MGQREERALGREKSPILGSLDGRSYVDILLKEIRGAAEEDEEHNKKGLPATKKLEILDDVYEKLLHKKVHEELLEKGVLKYLKRWLEPLPDKSLPNNTIKKKVLRILSHFSVEKEHLRKSGIGKIVAFYTKNPKEKPEIKSEAQQLLLKWIAVVTQE